MELTPAEREILQQEAIRDYLDKVKRGEIEDVIVCSGRVDRSLYLRSLRPIRSR